MQIKLRSGRFAVCASKAAGEEKTFNVHLYYKTQLLVSSKVNLQVVNFNSHTKEFAVKLIQRIYKAFVA